MTFESLEFVFFMIIVFWLPWLYVDSVAVVKSQVMFFLLDYSEVHMFQFFSFFNKHSMHPT